MPRRDFYHDAVRRALEKDGWTITHDPFYVRHHDKRIDMDLGAQKLIGAERNSEKIIVEIKSFLRNSTLYEFHTMLGQYRNYGRVLRKQNIQRQLFVAVPKLIYDEFFDSPFGQEAIEDENLKLIIFQPDQELITVWIK